MNDSDIPKPPPDNFPTNTPNTDKADWGKTNYKYPAQPPADDWGNTRVNGSRDDADFGKTFLPGANPPPTPDWGATQSSIRLPPEDFGGEREDYGNRGGGGNDFGATTPYFRLPEAERAKYQNIPLTPTQEAAKHREEERKKGGVPAWFWVSGGLLAMFLFAVASILVAYFILHKSNGYEAVVKGAPAGSSVLINGAYWGTTSDDGSINLSTLKAGETKKVEIIHKNYTCEPQSIKGEDGVAPEPIIARCKQVANVSNECINIKAGAYDVAEKCANKALDDLPETFSVDDLLRAMNLYIIQFASGKYDIPQRNLTFIERASGYVKKLPPSVVVEVGGHTDNVGSDDSNQTLSDNRAKAVREALVKFGVKSEMLTEKGYGKSKPIATNDTEDGKFQNRRIEYSAIKK